MVTDIPAIGHVVAPRTSMPTSSATPAKPDQEPSDLHPVETVLVAAQSRHQRPHERNGRQRGGPQGSS